ncbi:MAG: SDR family NAD(P)-dependent oxidoreductase, partial [Pseudomonadota bacterium]
EATFNRPVRVDEAVEMRCEETDGGLAIELANAGAPAVRIKLVLTETRVALDDAVAMPPATPPRTPKAVADAALATHQGELAHYLDRALLDEVLPGLGAHLPASQIALLLSTTRLVGMQCPGEHSIYAGLTLNLDPTAAESTLRYRVTRFDPRFGAVRIALEGDAARGQIEAFVRPPPQTQPDYEGLRVRVDAGRFAGQRALVIGGSRGLGELCVKALVAGGAEVCFTYHRGEADARRVAATLPEGRARFVRCDAADPQAPAAGFNMAPTHLYYFATPFIFAGVRGRFSDTLYRRFSQIYIEGFWGLADALAARGLEAVLYPSSVAVDEWPPGMHEYAVAKRGGEAVCEALARQHPLCIHRPRLPRLNTDQTASNIPVPCKDATEVMLRELFALADMA